MVNDLWWGFADRLKEGVYLSLTIEVPFRSAPIVCQGRILWKEEERKNEFCRYRLGVKFDSGDEKKAQKLFRYAVAKKVFIPAFTTVMLGLIGLSIGIWWQQKKVVLYNQYILKNYHNTVKEASLLKERLTQEEIGYKAMEREVAELNARIRKMEAHLKEVSVFKEEAAQLKEKVTLLKQENAFLQKKLAQRKQAQARLGKVFSRKVQEAGVLEEEVIEGMCRWIRSRQDLKSGLVLSYEGDRNLRWVSFTYDQALAAIVFLIFGDTERAAKILDFYLHQVQQGKPIYNAYYTDGTVNEYRQYSGVVAWIGIAALEYMMFTGSKDYFPLVNAVSRFLVQMMDEEGGIKGGVGVGWYSTEHNLDAAAFFNLFYKLTGNQEYKRISDRIVSWLSRYAYTRTPVPINRGKGDSTIATDTYAWSVTALGPQELIELQMSPDKILDFAVEECGVKTVMKSNQGVVEVEGFDFAKYRNMPRGGVVSCEWTAQMVLAFEIMAEYYRETDEVKYRDYMNRASFYLGELKKMIINSPSPVGKADPTLPYASAANVDTGHGWRTPYGNNTGSLAATAYFLIAYKGFNPLQGKFLQVSLKDLYASRSSETYTKVGAY